MQEGRSAAADAEADPNINLAELIEAINHLEASKGASATKKATFHTAQKKQEAGDWFETQSFGTPQLQQHKFKVGNDPGSCIGQS